MAGENDNSKKIYYSMGEVAEMLDVSTSLVRFWEKQFDIITPHKNKKGNRMFSPEDVRNLKTIYHLVKERGMTLAGAAKHLKANRGGKEAIERDMEIAERLASIRALLLEVRNELGGDGTVVDNLNYEPSIEDASVIDRVEPVPNATAEGTVGQRPVEASYEGDNYELEEEEGRVSGEVSVEQLVEQAHEEEVVDAMMEEAIEELIEDEPEEMLDFDPQPVFEPEPEEEPVAKAGPPKPQYIEQTLF